MCRQGLLNPIWCTREEHLWGTVLCPRLKWNRALFGFHGYTQVNLLLLLLLASVLIFCLSPRRHLFTWKYNLSLYPLYFLALMEAWLSLEILPLLPPSPTPPAPSSGRLSSHTLVLVAEGKEGIDFLLLPDATAPPASSDTLFLSPLLSSTFHLQTVCKFLPPKNRERERERERSYFVKVPSCSSKPPLSFPS